MRFHPCGEGTVVDGNDVVQEARAMFRNEGRVGSRREWVRYNGVDVGVGGRGVREERGQKGGRTWSNVESVGAGRAGVLISWIPLSEGEARAERGGGAGAEASSRRRIFMRTSPERLNPGQVEDQRACGSPRP